MARTAVAAGASVTVAVPAGARVEIIGSGTYEHRPSSASSRPTVVQDIASSGSWVDAASTDGSVTIIADGAGATYEVSAASDVIDPAGNVSLTAAHVAALNRSVRGPLLNDLADILPTHIPVLSPERHVSMGSIVSGSLTATYDAATSERGRGSIKLARAGSTTSATVTIPFTAGAEYPSTAFKIGSRVHVRVRCDDWTQIQRLYIGFYKPGDVNSYQYFKVIEANVSPEGCTATAASAVWNNQWRTLVFHSDKKPAVVGTAVTWDRTARYYDAGGVVFTVNQVNAGTPVNLWIDRIYSPDWPVGFCTVIGDGAYQSFINTAVAAFNARGWKLGVSGNRVDGTTSGVTTYPSLTTLATLAAQGHDVFQHGHYLSGATPIPLDGTAGQTEAAVLNVLALQQAAIRGALGGKGALGTRWMQWLTNAGRYNGGADMAGLVKDLGIQAGRADCSDAEYGIDPWGSKYTTFFNSPYSESGARMCGWVPPRGRFNRPYTEFTIRPSGGAETPTTRDTYAGNGLQQGLEYAASCGDGLIAYTHNIVAYDGTNPVTNDSGTLQWRDFLADLDAKVAAGSILVLSPTQLESLTYWRKGDVYVRWDGEWVNRYDGSIAF